MNKKYGIASIVAAAVIIGIVASFSLTNEQAMNLEVDRRHGSVDTSMGSPVLGSPSAPVTIVEFGDYQCEKCYEWFHTTKPAIYENFIQSGKANLVFVDLAMLGRDSPKAAQATYCAEDQGKYWEYHDLLYNSQEHVDNGWASPERLKAFAFNLGLDMELFNSCLDSGKYAKRVQHNIGVARENDARGTPTFIIVGPDGQQKIGGAQPYSVFENVLDSVA
ncbi:MAG: thioredoxin domain-containing protein [Nitrosopumilaceae archaeon]|nr:DsbA family protein [Nitrosopumilaceae archaeon]NIT99765.1 DsbA family protein [Nitrosopumilaceae archaeon]NIU88627.1 thioredoxin domain-containing protein [Nitrosopumilaceae archaeon]NIV64901.1 thioredoxin domain-containing protein [Nitrosopumilaceae archaeon]NIX60368.1 thioredoxin domain-containing protein [Nitrosopumilaceae archaeon]